ncbi:MAG: TonB-dependent receptor [Prolixibacteraceae bacterium]|jgi:hypothetical protein|nr:TonB-dependent receptor [Prolixibacteraceae bacterium]
MRKSGILSLFICLSVMSLAQQTLSGYVNDVTNGEALINATVYDSSSKQGVLTNDYGFFSLSLPEKDSIDLLVTYVGYSSKSLSLFLMSDSSLVFRLTPGIDLEEVSVISNRINLNNNSISAIKLPVKLLNQLPSFAGESDLARVLQLMPGVQSGKEGTSSLYVRGGSPDQNLILLDNMPIYFMNHIAGFISVFNPDAINYAELYKGAFPAQYGGHLSSVLDVRMKEGDSQDFNGNLTLGSLTSRITLEGPIKKDTSSYMVSFRRSMVDLFINGVQFMNHDGDFFAGIKVWDFNAKYNYRLSAKTRYFFSVYSGRDKFYIKQRDYNPTEVFPYNLKADYSNSWGNTVLAFRLNHMLSNNLFLNITTGYSGFQYNIDENVYRLDGERNDEVGKIESEHRSTIDEAVFKFDFSWSPRYQHQFNYGLNYNRTRFSPSYFNYLKEDDDESDHRIRIADVVRLNEFALYVHDNWKLGERLNADIGLRQVNYLSNKSKHAAFEPRLAFKYQPIKKLQLKLAYSEMSQFVHLLTNNEANLQTDFWVPSQGTVKPESSRQWVFGFDVSLWKDMYVLSVESYYKRMTGLIESNTGSSFFDSGGDWTQYVETDGKGRAMGVEWMLNKKSGKFTGWIGYTLSKNERQFASIDQGEWFAFKYDRTHNLSVVVNYEINSHINISANWVFMTGNAVTLPNEKFMLTAIGQNDRYQISGELWADIYPSRNNYRMPDYHRLDINLSFTREVYRGIRTWNIGLYNAYNQMNPYYLYFDTNEEGMRMLNSFTLFPILPSISYSLKF